MRILIADNHAPVRSALRRLLREEPGMQAAGEAACMGDLIRMARALQPDCIILDWDLSGLPGTGSPARREKLRNVLLASLRQIASSPALLVLSCWPECEATALRAGADAFVLKSDPPERLRAALRSLLPQ